MSPERKKSSSRHRSPTSRRSSSPADAQIMSSSSRKSSSSSSSYDNKSKSSDNKHSKEKNSDSHSSISNKSSPSNKNRIRSSRSKSPVIKTGIDSIPKDIDLRAQLSQPISITNSLISTKIIEQDLTASTIPTSSIHIGSNAITDRNTNIILDKRKNTINKLFIFLLFNLTKIRDKITPHSTLHFSQVALS